MTSLDPESAPTAPGPVVRSLFRFGPALLSRDPVSVAVDLRERYGHVVRIPPLYPGMSGPAFLVTHPDDVQTVLQTSPDAFRGLDVPGSADFAAAVEGSILGPPEGGDREWWIRRLRQVAPEFTEHHAARNPAAIARVTATTLAEYAGDEAGGSAGDGNDDGRHGRAGRATNLSLGPPDPAAVTDGGEGVRLQALAARLSLRLLGATLFDADVRLHEARVVRAVARLRRAFKRRTFGVVTGPASRRLPDGLTRALGRLRGPFVPDWVDRSRDPLADLRAVAESMVDRRFRLPGAFDDAVTAWTTRPDPVTGDTLSREAAASEVTGMLIAGFATVSAALTWAVLLVATHPEVAAGLHAEARDSALLSGSGTPPAGYAALLADLPVAHRVWRESLRLYPALPVFGRTTRRPVTLGGYGLAADAPVVLSPFVTQRDPAFWDAPERFDPERFRPERARGRHEFACYPFSAGAHGCLGRHVATVEGVVALATLCREYRVAFGGEWPGLDSAINLEPAGDVRVRLVARE